MLFFGLDFYYAKAIIKNTWKNGLIDVLPILEGGIRYVLKYLDKQMFGDDLKRNFTDNYIEPPFNSFSTGIGNELFLHQLNHIRTRGTYRNLAGKERPLPAYYRELLSAPELPVDMDKKLAKYEKLHPDGDLLHGYDDYEAGVLYARERALATAALNSGHAVYMPESIDVQHYGAVRQMMFRQYEQSKIKEADYFNEIVMQKFYELGEITL